VLLALGLLNLLKPLIAAAALAMTKYLDSRFPSRYALRLSFGRGNDDDGDFLHNKKNEFPRPFFVVLSLTISIVLLFL
jgi:hypothetical protein